MTITINNVPQNKVHEQNNHFLKYKNKVPFTGNNENISASQTKINTNKLVNAYQAYSLPAKNNQPQLIKADMKNVEMYDLPNNIRYIADTSPEIKTTTISFELKPNKIIQTKPATSDLLHLMLEDSSKKYSKQQRDEMVEKDNIFIFTGMDYNSITTRLKCPADKTNKAMNQDLIKEFLFNPDLSDENLQEAKKKLNKHLKCVTDDVHYNTEEELRYGSTKEKQKSIDSVTLQDIKDLYSQILSNSDGKVVITMPKNTYDGLKNKLLTSFSKGIPTLNKYQQINNANSIADTPLAKTQIYTQIKDVNKPTEVRQKFKIINQGNITDEVSARLLSILLEQKINTDLNKGVDKKQNRVISNYWDVQGTKYMSIEASTNDDVFAQFKNNPDNVKKSLESFKSNISYLVNSPIAKEDLDNAKLALKDNFAMNLADSETKNEYFASDTPYGVSYINTFIDTIDKITPEHIQKAAQVFLTSPSLISITASKNVLENNKEYLTSLC